jgi:ABC-type bacteriocin/lantibiotic exporter with double-glycine peptidase domain
MEETGKEYMEVSDAQKLEEVKGFLLRQAKISFYGLIFLFFCCLPLFVMNDILLFICLLCAIPSGFLLVREGSRQQ